MRRRTRRAAMLLPLLLVACTPQATPPTGTPAPSDVATVSPSASTDLSGWVRSQVAPMLRARDGFRVQLLGDGTILVAGDDGACHPGPAEAGSETTERYDPVADEWTIAAALNKPRKDFAMVPAQDGGVLIVGGTNAWHQAGYPMKKGQ